MNVEVMDYVEISKLRGESMWWIVWSEILPKTTAPLVAELVFGLPTRFFLLPRSVFSAWNSAADCRLGWHGA
ncbi:MAG: hypothetical protein CM1200mP18_14380 [Gammaproteobacteria bacterium]|nr:MAG: hypothetical protein CM1200mP18_14380 [Gammaproteobacteria bacterium]